MKEESKIVVSLVIISILSISIFGSYFFGQTNINKGYSERTSIIGEVETVKLKLKNQNKYNCWDDLMNGEEICGECLGEWIEGEGHACPMMTSGFEEAYPSIWESIKSKYTDRPLGSCPMM